MSKENVDRLTEITDALNRGDVAAYVSALDPKVEFEPALAELQGTWVGREGVRDWFAEVAELYVGGSVRVRYTDVRDLGDRVLAIGTIRFTGKGSGITTELPVALMVSFRNGLVTHLMDYGRKDKALEAAGLSE